MTLREYVLTYAVDDKIVCNLYDYYERFIKTLTERFSKYSYYTSNLVPCFFKDHPDNDPSMGSIKDKHLKNVRVCHCFGCGRTADVVRLHQILNQQYKGRELTERDSCLELAEMFKIPLDEFEELSEDDYEGRYLQNLKKVDRLAEHYTVRDFSQEVMRLRSVSVPGQIDLNKLNSACVRMIATVKQLYD